MQNILDEFKNEIEKNDFFKQIKTPNEYNSIGTTWEISEEIGTGFYWVYAQKDLFDIKIHDFFLHEDSFLEFNIPECLSITEYFSISGEELNPYRRLNAGCIKTFIGGYKPYRVLIHKNIPIQSIGIEIMPAFYEKYLKEQYSNKYIHPLKAFQIIDQIYEFPQIQKLFFELKNYKENNGLASHLYYESKVNECVSLVLDYANELKTEKLNPLAADDISLLNDVVDYINDHYAFDIPLKRLANIALMGTTKLKKSFKQYKGCTITEYIQARRMAQAEHLIIETDLNINQIAKTVGYSTSSRFATLFKETTGLLPNAYRKIAKK
ncbi:helix-turn-helix transcriptional regulator [Peptoniphilus sp. HCN-40583]|uniref:helix-turn-helix transcriptional regulator n=1 Tax=Peptoniphilus sp. HCN-40583 TaxID=3134662 RepID=UPI0030C4887C